LSAAAALQGRWSEGERGGKRAEAMGRSGAFALGHRTVNPTA
jgi:hypothetical protein